MKINTIRRYLTLLFFSLSISACGGGGNSSSDTLTDNIPVIEVPVEVEPVDDTPVINTSARFIMGQVRDFTDGSNLSNIEINLANQSVMTDADGRYQIPVDQSGAIPRLIVTASASGFAANSRITSIDAGETATTTLDIDLLPISISENVDPTQSFNIIDSSTPARVEIGAGTLVDSIGNLPSGSIVANLTPINPALNIDLMPGDLTISNGDPLASFGAITVDFFDSSGSELNLATGQTAEIRIPTSNRGSSPLPSTIPLFFFDEEQGFWVEEGSANLSVDGSYYEGTVSHFSTWNADFLYETINITGCVVDETGDRVTNTNIRMDGFDYNGLSSSVTDAAGNFSIQAMNGGISLVVASSSSQVSNTIEVGPTSSDVNIIECLILGNVPLTARLTWGQNPEDLDTHVFGPNNYHIYFVNLGSLTSAPFGQLDVDDVSSFGPEVFTALSFPQAGTYHYAVNLFDGTSSISASPARVVLNLNGEVTVFTPPTGSASDIWWNVFDIIVDSNNNITINSVNTLGTTPPVSAGRSVGSLRLPKKTK